MLGLKSSDTTPYALLADAADRRRSEELSEEEEAEQELERRQAAVEVVGEMQLTAEQLKVRMAGPPLAPPIAWTLRHVASASHMRLDAPTTDFSQATVKCLRRARFPEEACWEHATRENLQHQGSARSALADSLLRTLQGGVRALLAMDANFGELVFRAESAREAEARVTRHAREIAAQLSERARKEVRKLPFPK